jgi:8-amino-7-oxononanoate synthase
VRVREKILDRGKRALFSPALMRFMSDDRVMKAGEAILDARSRMKAAWTVLKNGHELPNIDPALDESIGEKPIRREADAKPARSNGSNGANGAAASSEGSSDMDESMKERTSLASIGGKDVFDKAFKFMAADNARKMGIYPFFRPLDFNDGPEAEINGKRVLMFGSNNYLGLTKHPKVREAAAAAIDRFGTRSSPPATR